MFRIIKNNCHNGQLSHEDIIRELTQNENFDIYSGENNIRFIKNNIRSASIDITPSIVAMSTKTGLLELVYREKSELNDNYYIYVKPKDTVLIVSNEYISLPNNIAGYVTSRVSNVSKGFGHISTTIDPNWNGSLLIALSNPSNHSLKIHVGTSITQENYYRNNLATVTFHYTNTPCYNTKSTYVSMRPDILKKMIYRNRGEKGFISYVKTLFIANIHFRRKKFTDYFFDFIGNSSSKEKWTTYLDEFSVINFTDVEKKKVFKYIISENVFHRIKQFCINHKALILLTLMIILLVLCKCGVIEKEQLTKIFDFIKELIFAWMKIN